MQYFYRVTKYNPANRNEKGYYLFQNEWICYSQIGKKCDGTLLTIDKYLEIEDKYINSIILFMQCNQIESLKVAGGLEKSWNPAEDPNSTKEMIDLFNKVKNGDILNIDQIKDFSRLALRKYVWCKLENDDVMFVHFYFDYYMYIGSQRECEKTIEQIQKSGLFVEDFKSPYHPDYDDEEE